MDRGLKIVLSGLVPILSVFLLSAIVDVSPAAAGVLVGLSFLASGALFLTGTALIVTDKGHPMVLGIVLGFLAPLGTIIALILEDQTGSATDRPDRPRRPIESRDGAPEKKKSKPGTFGPLREMLTRVAGFAGIGYALCYAVFYSIHLLKYQGGIPAAKVFIAVFSGVTAGLTLWGTVVMFTVTFAPQRWLLRSSKGQEWLARTGLKNQTSTIPVRILTGIIGTVAAGWTFISIMALISALTSGK